MPSPLKWIRVHVELAKLFIREVLRPLVLASSMTNNVSGNSVDITFFKAKLFVVCESLHFHVQVLFPALAPHLHSYQCCQKFKSLQGFRRPIYMSSIITPTRKTSLCLPGELKVGPPSSKKLLISSKLNGCLASTCLYLTLLNKLFHDVPQVLQQGGVQGAALRSLHHPQTLLLWVFSLTSSFPPSSSPLSWALFFRNAATIVSATHLHSWGGHAADAAVLKVPLERSVRRARISPR